MKSIVLLFLINSLPLFSIAQQPGTKLYDEDANSFEQIENAKLQANDLKKNIFLQVGGNWCKWCKLFDKWSRETPAVDSLFKSDFVVVHINYSKENKNEKLMSSLGFPQRFGFPVFIILDSNGNRLHTQNTAYLEEGEGYNEKKVVEFLKHWNAAALSEKNY
jgi:thioredoxin-related protein